jgi:glutamate-1-semialdehyde 2,1-aminomutase
VLGKFIGGGTPVGAMVGRGSLMDVLNPLQPGAMFHGGSFNGNVLGCSAGLITMKCLTASAVRKMDRQAEVLRGRPRKKAATLKLDVDVAPLGLRPGHPHRAPGAGRNRKTAVLSGAMTAVTRSF